jgi:hypothetical protein
VQHGAALFGICCTPTTCAEQGKNCGTIANGDCAGFTLDCGTCTAPDTCGGTPGLPRGGFLRDRKPRVSGAF